MFSDRRPTGSAGSEETGKLVSMALCCHSPNGESQEKNKSEETNKQTNKNPEVSFPYSNPNIDLTP